MIWCPSIYFYSEFSITVWDMMYQYQIIKPVNGCEYFINKAAFVWLQFYFSFPNKCSHRCLQHERHHFYTFSNSQCLRVWYTDEKSMKEINLFFFCKLEVWTLLQLKLGYYASVITLISLSLSSVPWKVWPKVAYLQP